MQGRRLRGDDRPMTTTIVLDLPGRVVAQARAAVAAGRADSLSAYVVAALAEHGLTRSLEDVLADLDDEHGPVSRSDLEWATAALGLTGPAPR